jgi:tetratricopeptide (TPR) repeat protein
VRTSGRSRKRQIILWIILAGIFLAGCHPRTVRVTVTDEDIKKANAAAQEGDIAFSRKENYAALIKYLEAARLNPNNANFLNRLGIAYSQLNLYDDARREFQSALNLNPKFSFALNNLGSVYYHNGNLKKAEQYFKKAVSLKADEASFHVNLGSLYLEKGKDADAKAAWRKAIALDAGALTKGSGIILKTAGRTSPMAKCFFMARFFASKGSVELAIENLKLAYSNGFSDIKAIEKQPDFDPVRKDDRFVEFMKDLSLQIRLRNKVGLPER